MILDRARRMADQLSKAGHHAVALQGNMSQGQRERAMKGFRTGQYDVLVATDIAARGIHVDDVSHVINYELPEVAEVYVHRIGRTARAGQSGIAVSLCSPEEVKLLRGIERLTGSRPSRDGESAEALPGEAETRREPRKAGGRQHGKDRPATAGKPESAGRRRRRPRRPEGQGAGQRMSA